MQCHRERAVGCILRSYAAASAGSRGRSEPLSAAECKQYRHAACHAA